MKKTKIIMGLPITIEIVDKCLYSDINEVFGFFEYIDRVFSTYKKNSEISKINKGLIKNYSKDMKTVFVLAEKTKKETAGFFDIKFRGEIDPSGIVKGWSIKKASNILKNKGYKNYYIEAGGDIEVVGKNLDKEWKIGIRNPWNLEEIIKVVKLKNKGIATSGTYIRGNHIYNPHTKKNINSNISLTVIANNVYNADRIATAAFSMGKEGINFIENLKGYEGYLIDNKKNATLTSNFNKYII